ncbi:MAG: GNAT family N-acetyltransferase [Verrucomicrobia bacterium]|nr:GNAT family N-acetyltransferase [Verrucomicrobiota bacterium]
MAHAVNHLGQPIGLPLNGWTPPPAPPREPMAGRCCRLEPLDVERHAADLFAAYSLDGGGGIWTYLPCGPFENFAAYRAWLVAEALGNDPLFFTTIDRATDKAVGVISYLRIAPASGSIEVGHVNFSPFLSRTPAATEAQYLMMKRAFELGYRRYEWKCDSLNAPSRAAAQRLGFSFEGVFRQAIVYKERSRDTAWYSVIDSEWPALERAFVTWLDLENFDAEGRQRKRLSDLTRPILKQIG